MTRRSEMTMNGNRGFTLLELLVSLVVFSLILAAGAGAINTGKYVSENVADQLYADFYDISMSLNNYQNELNTSPTGLTDTTFVPRFLDVPRVPAGFDSTYGTSGYFLGHQTGQPSPNNGWYVCAKTTVSNANDVKFQALKLLSTRLSATKFFFNTTCPALGNAADPAGATTLYVTYWVNREN